MNQTTQIELNKLFRELDSQHWGGTLHAWGWHCCLVPMDESQYGYASNVRCLIAIADWLVNDQVELRRTLLHEMIHAHLYTAGDRSHHSRNESHGAAFAAEVDRLHRAGEDVEEEKNYVVCGDTSVDSIQAAAVCYLDRQARKLHPAGKFDGAGRWYPSPQEWQSCCAKVRAPSRGFPWSLMAHCRSTKHVSLLYGVDTVALRDAIAKTKRSADE